VNKYCVELYQAVHTLLPIIHTMIRANSLHHPIKMGEHVSVTMSIVTSSLQHGTAGLLTLTG